MGREIRIGLMLTAAACLVAVLVDWAVQELNSEATRAGIEEQQASAAVPPAGEAGEVSVEAAQEDAGTAQDVTAESHDQG
jgi:negative regulator of sigma E activity